MRSRLPVLVLLVLAPALAVVEAGAAAEPVTSTVVLVVEPTTPQVGDVVRATVTVTADDRPDLVPTGAVFFTIGTARVRVVLDDRGVAVADLGPIRIARPDVVGATYDGDGLVAAGTAEPVPIDVARTTSTITSVDQTPAVVRTTGPDERTRAVLTVEVATPGVPVRGRVRVVRRGEIIASAELLGPATLRVPRFPRPGTKWLRLVYVGNSDAAPAAITRTLTVR